MPDNLPALSTSRPFIAPRMSAGMKAAIGFLIVVGILVLGGIGMTLTEIMHRLNSADQENVAAIPTAPEPVRTTTLASAAQSETRAYPAIGHAAEGDHWNLPQGAVVQQLVPHASNVYLLVEVPRVGQRIIIIDTKSGQMRRDIRLENGGK